MGTYLNPGNRGFSEICLSDYIDKTMLISLINRTIGTKKKLTCISRPRRFGKSYAAQMLCAYYDKSCDSHALFSGYKIAQEESYERHLNQYIVVNLDITDFISEAKREGVPLKEVPARIALGVQKEAEALYPQVKTNCSPSDSLIDLAEKTQTRIIFIIDEWDSLIREAGRDKETQERYLNLLRGWFKNNNFTPYVVAAAYMTGILPIKKDGSQSAISDFEEYTMLEPQGFAPYFGFTESEVQEICSRTGRSFSGMKKWYDGYTVGEQHSIYNPYSVMHAAQSGKYRSYWKKTSAAETLMTYIDMDQEGLQDEIARLISGESIVVDTDSFQNDVETFTCKEDVLTLLIHLGYLTYEEVRDTYEDEADEDDETMSGLARIPNAEVRSEFQKILRKAVHKDLVSLVSRSDRLLKDTIAGREEEVAKALQEIHDSEYAPTFYNNEQSLRYVVKMAYLSCVDQYAKIEELPSGHGIADVVFLPKRRSPLPAMIIELKWNRSAEGALLQIRDKAYPMLLRQFEGEIILVGVNYDADTKIHSCRIEKQQK